MLRAWTLCVCVLVMPAVHGGIMLYEEVVGRDCITTELLYCDEWRPVTRYYNLCHAQRSFLYCGCYRVKRIYKRISRVLFRSPSVVCFLILTTTNNNVLFCFIFLLIYNKNMLRSWQCIIYFIITFSYGSFLKIINWPQDLFQ